VLCSTHPASIFDRRTLLSQSYNRTDLSHDVANSRLNRNAQSSKEDGGSVVGCGVRAAWKELLLSVVRALARRDCSAFDIIGHATSLKWPVPQDCTCL
jgi:hypothetical protein